MAKKIIVEKQEWKEEENRFKYCTELENGNLLFFPSCPFHFPQDELDFLLMQKQKGSKTRKNIAYKPGIDRITNHDAKDPAEAARLKQILKNYSIKATDFLTLLLAPYAPFWKHDYASFRPFQEKGRNLRLRARNDLLHVDAFPSRPLHGARILRFFTNINPEEDRHWITSDGFEKLAQQYLSAIPAPPSLQFDWLGRLQIKMKRLAAVAGFPIPLRSPYDTWMLNMHNFLKENAAFQKECAKDHWRFPPGSCWAVFTDQVSHAAISGQYALEQTFIVPQKALLCPEKSPLAVLERLSGRNWVDPAFSRHPLK